MISSRHIFLLSVFSLSTIIYGQSDLSEFTINRNSSVSHSLRILSLGEMKFSEPSLYNLYDQGGSPIALLDGHPERINLSLGLQNSDRASSLDSLSIESHQFFIPQFGFFQPGVFGAVLYYQKEKESYNHKNGDSVETNQHQFGIDLAAGPSSGLFRIGFGVHTLLGTMEYPGIGNAERFLLEVPSLRIDLGSKIMQGIEIGVFTALSAHFDSLNSPQDKRERLAAFSLPRYGLLADIGGLKNIPLTGNVSLEIGTHQFFGEYRQVGQGGIEYPTIWNSYWSFATQWLYPFYVNDFKLQPAILFSKGSEDVQGYKGIKGNQNPLKKGDINPKLAWTQSTTNYGVGGSGEYRELVNVMFEWETSGKTLKWDTTSEISYSRVSMGTEVKLNRIAALKIPPTFSPTLRMGWIWNQMAKKNPGYRDYQFNTFLPSQDIPTQLGMSSPKLEDAIAYTAFHLGVGMGVLDNKFEVNVLLSFPSQPEVYTPVRTQEVSGTEFGLNLTARVF